MLRRLIAVDAAVLLAVALVNLLLALRVWEIGSEPGSDAVAERIASPTTFFATVAGFALALGAARRRERAVAVLAPAAGLVLIAFFYTYDSYYAPSLVRYADRIDADWWVYLVAAGGLAVSAVASRRPYAGGILTALWLPVFFLTVIVVGDGH